MSNLLVSAYQSTGGARTAVLSRCNDGYIVTAAVHPFVPIILHKGDLAEAQAIYQKARSYLYTTNHEPQTINEQLHLIADGGTPENSYRKGQQKMAQVKFKRYRRDYQVVVDGQVVDDIQRIERWEQRPAKHRWYFDGYSYSYLEHAKQDAVSKYA